jgi:broad specificity phosphatase PhoE
MSGTDGGTADRGAALRATPTADTGAGAPASEAAGAATRRIGFARHGDTAWTGHRYVGRTDLPMTDAGATAAAALASRVADSGLLSDPAAIIVTSTLRRCVDTAGLVARATGRPVDTDPRWVEAGFGAAEGCTFEEVRDRWPDLADRMAVGDIAIDWPDGEPWSALRDRVTAALDAVLARDVPALVVSHGIAIRAALSSLLAPVERAAGLPVVRPASLVVLGRRDGGWAIEAEATSPGVAR